MKDLTKDPVLGHVLALAAPIFIGMISYVAYQLIDLYFLGSIGVRVVGGANAASNVVTVIGVIAQIVGVGTTALIAHAVGRHDRAEANLLFHQSVGLALTCGIVAAVCLSASIRPYLQLITSDAAMIDAGSTFVLSLAPGFVLMLLMSAITSALRGLGVAQAPSVIYVLTVVANAILAPALIKGWGPIPSLGSMGAGLATTLAYAFGVAVLGMHLWRSENYLQLDLQLLRPSFAHWQRIVRVGLPTGGEVLLLFLSTSAVYYLIRPFGAETQAGFGIGSRILQAVILPALALSAAAVPVAGQNVGARNSARVRETFRQTTAIVGLWMLSMTIIVQLWSMNLAGVFTENEMAAAAAAHFLELMSWTFIAQGLIYSCSIMFQGFGNTVPSLIGESARFFVFLCASLWLAAQVDFALEHLWYVMISSVLFQAGLSLRFLHVEFKRRLLPIERAA